MIIKDLLRFFSNLFNFYSANFYFFSAAFQRGKEDQAYNHFQFSFLVFLRNRK